MSLRWKVDGAEGLAAEVERSLAHAVTAAVRDETAALKADLRAETQAAFKGNRLPLAWRARVYPGSGDSIDAAGWVEARASAAVILDLAFKGGTIRARDGRWLAVPTRAAGQWGLKAGRDGFGTTVNSRAARERVTPGGFERRTGIKLRFVYEKGGRRAFLVADQAMLRIGVARSYRSKGRGSKLYGPSGQTIVVFTLVPQVTAKKRLDRDSIAERAAARFPGRLVGYRGL